MVANVSRLMSMTVGVAVLLFGAAPLATAQLTLIESGGTFAPLNMATGGTPFAAGELDYGTHYIVNLNDGAYGNASSWIGAAATAPIAGISFDQPTVVGSIAWGRDNTGAYNDRNAGLYQVQYTTTPDPDASTPDAAWTTIGAITYDAATPDATPWSRHLYEFAPVSATGIRLVVPQVGLSSGTAIDEIELYTDILLTETGGTAGTLNIAPQGNAFAKDVISGYPIHQIAHLNDGLYGNDNSWVAASAQSFVGVDLGGGFLIDGIAWGRDNLGDYADRCFGAYTVQITTVDSPNASTSDADWLTIGSIAYDAATPDATPSLRHFYEFGSVYATGVRLLTDSSAAGGSSIAIDEIEVYTVPEPGALAMLLIGSLALARRRRN
ncbi:MAG: PEP-CTERM sorting domain-containing protein [Phycisphaerae bacterium]|nr:PEP-CTERM sorting domain-containing protein [Phycisphaerae bacterium]